MRCHADRGGWLPLRPYTSNTTSCIESIGLPNLLFNPENSLAPPNVAGYVPCLKAAQYEMAISWLLNLRVSEHPDGQPLDCCIFIVFNVLVLQIPV